MRFYDCPKCGKSSSSSDGIHFCVKCEQNYQADIEQAKQRDLLEVEKILKEHKDCDCYICRRALAKKYELTGRPEMVDCTLNS